MDPFCKIKTKSGEFRTEDATDMGKLPHWDETFEVQLDNEILITVAIWDKDTFSPDALLGETKVNLHDKLSNGACSCWFDLFLNDKNAGRIHMEMQV